MPDIGTWLVQHWDSTEHAVSEAAEHLVHGEDPYASQAPAAMPVNLKAATAAQPPEEDMSVATDVETWYADAKAKFGEAEQKLPELIADAKKLDGNPLAAIAIQAGEHVAASVLPPEALTYIGTIAKNALDGLLSLYNPQGTAAPAAPAEPAPPPAAA